MITVHNIQKTVAKPVISSIVYDPHAEEKVAPSNEGWQAFSGKSTITWPSPQSASEPSTASAGRLSSTTMDNVNRAKFIELAIGASADDLTKLVAKTGETHLLSASAFGNWRKREINGFSDISNRIMLMSDEIIKPSYSIKLGTEPLGKKVLDSGIAKKVSKTSQTINELAMTAAGLGVDDEKGSIKNAVNVGERMSVYSDFSVLLLGSTTTDVNISSLKFTFKFGQAGIFSGEEEVVKPILALVRPWALKGGEHHFFTGPIPSAAEAERMAFLQSLKFIKKESLNFDLPDLKNVTSGIATTVKAFNEITDKLYKLVDDVAVELFSKTTTLTAIIGSLVIGPLIPSGISWNFNFENVDEYGYPCEGSVTFDGLKPIRKFLGSDYTRQWGYGAEYSKNVPAIEKNILSAEAIQDNAIAQIFSNEPTTLEDGI